MEMTKLAYESSAASGPELSPVKIPNTQELYDFFQPLLKSWTGLSAQNAIGVDDEVQPLSLERGLMFTQPSTGILVIRTAAEFEALLQKAATGGKPPSIPRDVFVELFILFWHRFVSKFWGLDSRKLPPASFKKSIPRDWPNRRPDASLVVFVENYPLAVRLWAPVTEAEMNHWRNPVK